MGAAGEGWECCWEGTGVEEGLGDARVRTQKLPTLRLIIADQVRFGDFSFKAGQITLEATRKRV